MRVFITGHTKGVGKVIHDFFKYQHYDVVGLSTTNGYNLEKDFELIVDMVGKNDIFVNNSYANGIQLKFMERLHGNVAKMIVCGSTAARFTDFNMLEYSANKLTLENRFYELAIRSDYTKMLLLTLTSSSYKDRYLIEDSLEFWLKHPDKTINISYSVKT